MSLVAVAGSSGFVGAAVATALTDSGATVLRLPSIRVDTSTGELIGAETAGSLVELLQGCDVIINAAGLASSGSNDAQALHAANALLPVALFQAAREAGVGRMVHVSSAAVQGRLDPLDETEHQAPFSPYSASKAAGERLLLEQVGGPELAIYRATSVQGVDRDVTRLLMRYASLPILPMSSKGTLPLPMALIENCAAAISHLALIGALPGPIALHPWEEVTVGTLLTDFGWNHRAIPVPLAAARTALRAGARITRSSSRLTARMRSIELLLLGQGQRAATLSDTGFVLPVGRGGFRDLALRIRQSA